MHATPLGMFCCNADGSQTSTCFILRQDPAPKAEGIWEASWIYELEHLEAFCICNKAHLKARQLF